MRGKGFAHAGLTTSRDAHHDEETNRFHFIRKRISPAFGT
jgi:hypothetical protein